MEYLFGFVSSILIIIIYNLLAFKKNIEKKIGFSQVDKHQVISNFLVTNSIGYKNIKKNIKTQSQLHEEKNSIKVIIMDNSAYWIKDNVFYTAQISLDGNVDKDTTSIVDTMAMDKVQLDKMMFIIDRLREGTFDDSGGTGN